MFHLTNEKKKQYSIDWPWQKWTCSAEKKPTGFDNPFLNKDNVMIYL